MRTILLLLAITFSLNILAQEITQDVGDFVISKYGVPNGIYVYFDYFDMKYNNTQLLLSEIKYAGSCQITIPFVNSLRSIDYNYDLYASKRIVNFDINNIEKPTLRRSRNVPYLNFHEMNETIQDLREDVMNLQYAC